MGQKLDQKKKLNVAEIKMLRYNYGVTGVYRVRNDRIRLDW